MEIGALPERINSRQATRAMVRCQRGERAMILYGLRTYDFNDQNDQRWGLKSLRSFRSLGRSFSTEVIFGNRTALKKTTLPPTTGTGTPPAHKRRRWIGLRWWSRACERTLR